MLTQALVLELHLLTGRYHGATDWPPSPFRLFQALIAGAYGGRWRSEPPDAKDAAFEWLERLGGPSVVAPRTMVGRGVTYYVPNNDLDARAGDPRHTPDIRVAKTVVARVVDDEPIIYAWPFDGGAEHARTLCGLADRLHTLGRGVDAAFARAMIVKWIEAEARLVSHGGRVRRPSSKRGRPDDPTCPAVGSFCSLEARYIAESHRYTTAGRETHFRRAPKAHFTTVRYDSRPVRLLFDLRATDGETRRVPQEHAAEVTSKARALIANRLVGAMPSREAEIRLAVDGAQSTSLDDARRIKVVPLPTIGHVHAGPAIRRLAVEVPADCPITASDIGWALGGQSLAACSRGPRKEGADGS